MGPAHPLHAGSAGPTTTTTRFPEHHQEQPPSPEPTAGPPHLSTSRCNLLSETESQGPEVLLRHKNQVSYSVPHGPRSTAGCSPEYGPSEPPALPGPSGPTLPGYTFDGPGLAEYHPGTPVHSLKVHPLHNK